MFIHPQGHFVDIKGNPLNEKWDSVSLMYKLPNQAAIVLDAMPQSLDNYDNCFGDGVLRSRNPLKQWKVGCVSQPAITSCLSPKSLAREKKRSTTTVVAKPFISQPTLASSSSLTSFLSQTLTKEMHPSSSFLFDQSPLSSCYPSPVVKPKRSPLKEAVTVILQATTSNSPLPKTRSAIQKGCGKSKAPTKASKKTRNSKVEHATTNRTTTIETRSRIGKRKLEEGSGKEIVQVLLFSFAGSSSLIPIFITEG